MYAQLILDIGPKSVCETAKLLGITTKLDCYPAEGLAAFTRGVTPLEMAAYAIWPAAGSATARPASSESCSPTARARTWRAARARVLTDGEAEVTRILEMKRPVGHRHGGRLRLPRGRQDRHHRRGQGRLVRRVHPHLSAAVWVGYPDAGIAMPNAQGTYAAPVWHAFMLPAHGEDCDDFPLLDAEFHPFFGKYSSTGKPVVPYYDEDDGTTTRAAAPAPTRSSTRATTKKPQNAPDVQCARGAADQVALEQGADPRPVAPAARWPSST